MNLNLIVGLQNPGSQYEQTRHNVGAWFIHALAERKRIHLKLNKKIQGWAERIPESTCYLFLPQAFMNHNGIPLQHIMHYYNIAPQAVLVAHDDLDLPVGAIKLKAGGGHGGHNGLRSLIQQLGHNTFYRLKIGIGHPGHKDKVHDYVLSNPSNADKHQIEAAIHRALNIIPLALQGEWPAAMQYLHTKEKG